MSIDIKIDGTSTVLPNRFEKYYININNNQIESSFISYDVKIHIDIKFSLLYMVTIRKWKYYSWIDSFLNELNKEMSKDNYFKRINWESVLTVMQCIDMNNKDKNNVNSMNKHEAKLNIIISELCDKFLENNEHIC